MPGSQMRSTHHTCEDFNFFVALICFLFRVTSWFCYFGIIFPEVQKNFENPTKNPLGKEFIGTTDAEMSTTRSRHLYQAEYAHEIREMSLGIPFWDPEKPGMDLLWVVFDGGGVRLRKSSDFNTASLKHFLKCTPYP